MKISTGNDKFDAKLKLLLYTRLGLQVQTSVIKIVIDNFN